MFRGKKYKESAKLIDRSVQYDPAEALGLVVKGASAKFDETVELHIKLGVDSRHADQQVRGAVVLPNGTGKTRRVLVFTKDAKVDEAKAAGADYVGGMDLVEKITKENWFDFDVVVASPDMMGIVGRLGKVLGPKGLMPSPKAGTVTPNVGSAVKEIKAGKVDPKVFRRVDYVLLLTFLCFFVFSSSIAANQRIAGFLERAVRGNEYWWSIGISQIISNVPASIVLWPFTADLRALIYGLDTAGLVTVIGSLASVINLRLYTREYPGQGKAFLVCFEKISLCFFAIVVVLQLFLL